MYFPKTKISTPRTVYSFHINLLRFTVTIYKLANLFLFLGNLATKNSTTLDIPQTFSNGPVDITVACCSKINCLFCNTSYAYNKQSTL